MQALPRDKRMSRARAVSPAGLQNAHGQRRARLMRPEISHQALSPGLFSPRASASFSDNTCFKASAHEKCDGCNYGSINCEQWNCADLLSIVQSINEEAGGERDQWFK